jgi:acetyltransferase
MSGKQVLFCSEAREVQDHTLAGLFAPRSIALIGASDTPGSVGEALLRNLGAYDGLLFAVNPRHPSIGTRKVFPNISALPQQVDLAVIATPAPSVPAVLRECGGAGVKAAIVISAGFGESGPEGAGLASECLSTARSAGIRLLGPNCLGLMIPRLQLNATFAGGMAAPGGVAFLSQSGALCTAVLDWSLRENVGFSAFVSVGSMLDTGWDELLAHFDADPETTVVLCYIESIGHARSFLTAARRASHRKPVAVLKVGRTAPASKAAASHTGALTGTDAVLDAAFRSAGVLRMDTLDELFNLAEMASKQPHPVGPRLAIVTNAGGPAALATDALVSHSARLAELSAHSVESLNKRLPPQWSHANPIDILGDAGADRYAAALEVAVHSPESDAVLVILTPQSMTQPGQTAEAVRRLAKTTAKPVFASWMGGAMVAEGRQILNAAGIPTFDYPDAAANAFAQLWRCRSQLGAGPVDSREDEEAPLFQPEKSVAERLLLEAAGSRNRLLSSVVSARILSAYGIPVLETRTALSEEEAVRHSGDLGFPVAVKLLSETRTHKSDVGGVRLDVGSPEEVREAWGSIRDSLTHAAGRDGFNGVTIQPMVKSEGYELILGCSRDPQFGPVILFGSGGTWVEIYRDTAFGFPPLDRAGARRLIEETKIGAALRGVRGRPGADISAVETAIMRFSRLVLEQPLIGEVEINPLLALPCGLLAIDSRMALQIPREVKSTAPEINGSPPGPALQDAPFPPRHGAPKKARQSPHHAG